MTPISQQNPPGPLKLLGLNEKTGKNTDFLILLKKTDFLVAHFVTSCIKNDIKNDLKICRQIPDPPALRRNKLPNELFFGTFHKYLVCQADILPAAGFCPPVERVTPPAAETSRYCYF